MLSVLISTSYGGFGFSDRAVDEYNRRKGPDVPALSKGYCSGSDFDRTDALMVQIVQELGKSASGSCANVVVRQIPLRYEKHFQIEEYDGSESIKILYDRYALDQIRALLHSVELSDEAKVRACLGVFDGEVHDEDDRHDVRSVVFDASE